MKKLYTTLFFICLGIFTQLSAQTIKNIHRHNLPVLQIPVELIDKVQTVEVNGIKNLQITPLFGEITQIPISEIDSITHYLDSVNPQQLGVMRTASVIGIVRDTGNAPVNNAIVRSPYGGEQTYTDANGVFFLNNIIVYDKLGYITIEKPGFHKGSRSFLPLEQGSNRVNIQLLPMTMSGFFNSATGGQVSAGLLQLTFPANAIVQNGQLYNGQVRVYAQALDPSSTAMFDQMPGDLLGGMNDSLRLLRSFGMAAVELRDANFQLLQLQPGIAVIMNFTIPTSLIAEAPETIDWWSFDEALGYWKHEGIANKQGSFYQGYASHFSWWNCDVPQNFNDFNGTINSTDGNPITDAQVNVVTPTMGTGITYTNAEGVFSGRVPKNQTLTLNINLMCNSSNNWELAYTEIILSAGNAIEDIYTASLSGFYRITGTVVNCQNQPVESGFIKLGQQIYFTNNGEFFIQTCTMGEVSIRAYDTYLLDSLRVSELIQVQVESTGANVGTVQACSETIGSIMDVEGNFYQTVLIGNQWWMSENLKTTHFADSSEISMLYFDWTQFGVSACAYYNNDSTNVANHGILYNWAAAADPRNVCPTGWHVPSTEEWTELEDFLGGYELAGGKLKLQGAWASSSMPSSNESGFSAKAGGLVHENLSASLYNAGYWWSTSLSTTFPNFVVSRYMHSNYNSFYTYDTTPDYGFSVRCLKD